MFGVVITGLVAAVRTFFAGIGGLISDVRAKGQVAALFDLGTSLSSITMTTAVVGFEGTLEPTAQAIIVYRAS